MIIARIVGGLGNQLFIYASTRALGLRTGRQLLLDPWGSYEFDPYGGRYLLDQFCCVGTLAKKSDVERFQRNSRSLYWQKKLDRRLPFGLRTIIEERSPFEPRLLTFRPRALVYLIGYWARERYFRDHADAIRREFTWRNKHSAQNLALGQRMRQCESVFLHVRRHDYKHLLSATYYAVALRMISERVRHTTIFVFGEHKEDDLEWAKRALPLPADTQFVEHNGEAGDFEDLWLMTQCRHAIVANSTFSWWGAWLNNEPTRIVVAPETWGFPAPAAASGWLTVSPDQCGVG